MPSHRRRSELFSPVPLTPRADAPPRSPAARSPRQSSFRALLHRGLTLISLPPPHRPHTSRADSEHTVCSASTSGTSSSIDTGHLSLIPSVGTTDKFTHKWPRPRSLHIQDVPWSTTRYGGAPLGQAAAAALEDGQGLGMDKVDRWSPHKWCLLLSVASVLAYGAGGLVCALLTWFRTWTHADVMYIADNDVLILITLASSLLLFTASIGTTGVFLNSRPILAIYALLLWPAFISILAIGYIAYKRSTFALDHKLNLAWSQYFTPPGRLLIQNALNCCGFYSPAHNIVLSNRCYPRTQLPGCKGSLYAFERVNLTTIWSAAFALVPFHIINIITALLCANQMTNPFGKGITPKKYRLSCTDLKLDAERILGSIETIPRPKLSKIHSSGMFREDREERMLLLRQVDTST